MDDDLQVRRQLRRQAVKMHMKSGRMWCVVPLLLFAAATTANVVNVDWRSRPGTYVLGSVLIASPFAVLAAAHFTVAKGVRSHLFLLTGKFIVGFAVFFVSFLVRWFQPGWAGVTFLAMLLLNLGIIWSVGGWSLRDKHVDQR